MNQSFKVAVNECCGDTLIARLAEKGITAIKNGLIENGIQVITCLNMSRVEYHKMFTLRFMCVKGISKCSNGIKMEISQACAKISKHPFCAEFQITDTHFEVIFHENIYVNKCQGLKIHKPSNIYEQINALKYLLGALDDLLYAW